MKQTLCTIIIFSFFSTGAYAKTGIILGNHVNIRSLPNIKAKVLMQLNKGDKVIVTSKNKTTDPQYKYWYSIRIQSTSPVDKRNINGFVFHKLIRLKGISVDVEADNGLFKIVRNRDKKIMLQDNYSGDYDTIILKKYYQYHLISLLHGNESRYSIIYDLEKNSIATRLAKNLDNPSLLSISPSQNYMILDTGTAASVRNLQILNLITGNIIFRTSYTPVFKPVWIKENTITFYVPYGAKAPGKPRLLDKGDGTPNSYIQKIIWENGKVIKTKEFEAVYSEMP